MDGADWLQKLLDRYRPDAVRVLDFPHALEHLASAAQATFGAGSASSAAWLAEQAHALKHDAPRAVLAALRVLPTAAAADPAGATRARDATLGYLAKRRDQLRYAEFLALGYPIGSGLIESANKLVVEARLKDSGMHWAPEHVNPMLALRTIACADRWTEAWPRICDQLRTAAQARRAARARQRRARGLPRPLHHPPARLDQRLARPARRQPAPSASSTAVRPPLTRGSAPFSPAAAPASPPNAKVCRAPQSDAPGEQRTRGQAVGNGMSC
jgi:hypothetical protein